jgi:predicted permease
MNVTEKFLPSSFFAAFGAAAPQLDWRVLAGVLLMLCVAVVASGLLPAIRTARVAIAQTLNAQAGTTTGSTRRRDPIVIAEIALALSLLVGTGLLIKAADRVSRLEFGFDARHLLSAWIKPESFDSSASRSVNAVAAVEERLRRVPGILAVTRIQPAGIRGHAIRGTGTDDGMRRLNLRSYAVVDAQFLQTMGIPLVSGRDFEPGDAANHGAVIVDANAARALWPHGGAVGARIALGSEESNTPWLPVVGVARPAVFAFEDDPDAQPEPTVYAVLPPGATVYGYQRLAIRLRDEVGTPGSGRVSLIAHRTITDANTRVFIEPWQAGFSDVVRARNSVAVLFAGFGALALFLSAVGIFSTIAYSVAQRLREFGVRLALGATPRDIFRLVLTDASVMILAGTGAGAFLSMWASKLLDSWLYGVNPTDVTALVSAELVIVAVSLASCVMPALRGARADPIEILRSI